jgi:hypothetical protein
MRHYQPCASSPSSITELEVPAPSKAPVVQRFDYIFRSNLQSDWAFTFPLTLSSAEPNNQQSHFKLTLPGLLENTSEWITRSAGRLWK